MRSGPDDGSTEGRTFHSSPTGGLANPLREFHERLESHFGQLRTERNQLGQNRPIFALEHGLNDVEVVDLKAYVRGTLRSGSRPSRWWLPMVAYAAEVGYRYTGDEYWQTFEAETPGWIEHGDRQYIRQRFQDFSERFGGAQPTGPWAQQFSIICWPITHAVLPTDLQYHLARLLYEYRQVLTPQLLSTPDELGAKLASFAWSTSSRFANFSQNTSLLGQVAAALLLGEEGDSPLLLSSTLTRIIADLSLERQARRWLSDAKTAASRVNIKGFGRASEGSDGVSRHREAGGERLAPEVLLRRDDEARWAVFVELPDFSVIGARSSELVRALDAFRCRVAGYDGAPLARGRLLWPGQVVRLSRWPSLEGQLLRLENADTKTDEMLAEECRLSSGPVWLFRVRDPSLATEVKGRSVRPGGEYVLLTTEDIQLPLGAWVESVQVDCASVAGYRVRVPSPVGADTASALEALGIGVVSNVDVRPVGPVPSKWDSEGSAEWVAGDRPLLEISSTQEISGCIMSIDGGTPERIQWPSDGTGAVYVLLSDLAVGSHEFSAMLIPSRDGAVLSGGTLSINVREPRPQTAAGTYRQALVLMASPSTPSLADLWQGKAVVEVLGPAGLPIDARVSLQRSRGDGLLTRPLRGLRLPVSRGDWTAAFDDFRELKEAKRRYDDASACVIEVSHPDLGEATMTCERPFAPLRWGVGADQHGPFARLHDNVGAARVAIERFDFSRPTEAIPVETDPESKLRWDPGGLFVARFGPVEAGVILSPRIDKPEHLIRAMVRPTVVTGPRSAEAVMEWVAVAQRWHSAELPGDLFARVPRDSVLRALTIAICALIGGPRWARGEFGVEREAASALRELRDALSSSGWQRVVAAEVERSAGEYPALSLEDRIGKFAEVVNRTLPYASRGTVEVEWLAEYLLRLASSPGEVALWSGTKYREGVDVALQASMMFRAARYIVLSVHLATTGGEGASPYRGWQWQ